MSKDHYVPQCVLRGFIDLGLTGEKVHVWDKRYGKSRIRSIDSYFQEENGNATPSFPEADVERFFDRFVEDKAGDVLHELRRSRSAVDLDERRLDSLRMLVAAQIARTPGFRNRVAESYSDIIPRIEVAPRDPAEEARDADLFKLRTTAETLELFPTIRAMDIAILEAPIGTEFVIGDDPVVQVVEPKIPEFTNLSIGVHRHFFEGSITVMPITASLCLQLIAPEPNRRHLQGRSAGVVDAIPRDVIFINKKQLERAATYVGHRSPSLSTLLGS